MENRISFTKAMLDALPLPEAGKRSTFLDRKAPGLQIRVTSSGVKTFSVFRRVGGGAPERITIGRYPEISIEQARRRAAEVSAVLVQGTSHKDERRARKARVVTIGEVMQDFLEGRKNLSQRTRYDYGRVLDAYLWDWKGKPIAAITKDMVAKRHAEIAEGIRIPSKRSEDGWITAASKAQANYSMRVLRALINFASVKYEDSKGAPLILENPVRRLSQTRSWYRIDRRQTVIKVHELPAWFAAVLDLKSDAVNGKADVVRDYLLFMILTGVRRNEAARIRKSDVDIRGKAFTIVDTKNKQPHTLPLSDYLAEVVGRRIDATDSTYLFPGTGQGGYLVEPKKQINKVIQASGVKFTLHDLRRTFATIAENIEVPAYALKRLLNHKTRNDVTAGYIVTDVERLRAPMQKISDFILSAAGVR